jgi:hypothetical protein
MEESTLILQRKREIRESEANDEFLKLKIVRRQHSHIYLVETHELA